MLQWVFSVIIEKKDKLLALSEKLLKERELDRAAIEAVLGPRLTGEAALEPRLTGEAVLEPRLIGEEPPRARP